MSQITRKISRRIQHSLSRHPTIYALIVGVGIVLFWRGVWHSADQIHLVISHIYFDPSLSLTQTPWWDGPLSFFVGCFVLYFTGAFTSSFIGSELILSGLRGEKRLSERTEEDLKGEVVAIADIKDELGVISQKLEVLQKHAHENHHKL